MKAAERDEFGLTERDTKTMRDIIDQYPEVRRVVIFGSRAKGTFAQGSDIDLAIMNSGVTEAVITRMKSAFQESTLPYFIDVINYPALQHPDLKNHIDRVGKAFYLKKN
jgi:uncharacterized protein